MIADSAAGYAAMTLVPANASVLTVEYKMNLLAPADGEKLIARGQVLRSGRTLIVTKAEVFAVKAGKETLTHNSILRRLHSKMPMTFNCCHTQKRHSRPL